MNPEGVEVPVAVRYSEMECWAARGWEGVHQAREESSVEGKRWMWESMMGGVEVGMVGG
jgi:hypothetical protein